jgi:hypothetical protein
MAGQNSSILGVCDILGLSRPEYLEYQNSQSDYQQVIKARNKIDLISFECSPSLMDNGGIKG